MFDLFLLTILVIDADNYMITGTWNKYWSSRCLKGTDELSQVSWQFGLKKKDFDKFEGIDIFLWINSISKYYKMAIAFLPSKYLNLWQTMVD